MIYTTFALCKAASTCKESYLKFRRHKVGRKWPLTKPFALTEVLDVLGLDEALWCLRCTTDQVAADKLARLYACDCAERVLPLYERQYPGDMRVRDCIAVVRRYANGQATREELTAARAAAWAAAWAAEAAAEAAAWAAARAAAWAAEREWQAQHLREMLEIGE